MAVLPREYRVPCPGPRRIRCVGIDRAGVPRQHSDRRPFTKDLVYGRGFLEVYDFMRLAVKRGRVERLPLLFAGKLAVREMGAIAHLAESGIVVTPGFIPPHLRDVSALASWMAFSNLLNRIDLGAMEAHLADALD